MEKPENIQEIEGLVLFDGVCNLCHGSVNFLLDQDKNKQIIFTSLQSETGQEILTLSGLSTEKFDSVLFYDRGRLWDRSDAALEIMNRLGGAWKTAAIIGRLIPKSLRDGIYKFIARNRYAWFGRTESCRLPTLELKSRFLD